MLLAINLERSSLFDPVPNNHAYKQNWAKQYAKEESICDDFCG